MKAAGACPPQANPHRPGISPALGLRAKDDDRVILSQTASNEEIPMSAYVQSNSTREKLSARRQRKRPKQRCRLQLEPLQDRWLLSGHVVLDWIATLSDAIKTAPISPLLP